VIHEALMRRFLRVFLRGRPSPRRTVLVVVSFVCGGVVLVAATRHGSAGNWIGSGLIAGSIGVAITATRQHCREAKEQRELRESRPPLPRGAPEARMLNSYREHDAER
jgi:hypothetical protein